jgi:NAD(P)-dependent dehydrogenase (short-subunit alcohol dehydrogenase family)
VADPFAFDGRVVLVTGGTRGIGAGVAAAFAAHRATVVVCGRTEPAGPGPGSFLACDVRQPEQVDAMVTSILDRWGRLDVVVNNAGGSPPADAATASPRFSTAIVELNLLAPLHVAQRANAAMQGQPDGGAIVNVASVSGLRPSPGTAAYGAAKAGLVNLTQSLAVEWAPKVRVNCVSGGLVATEQSHLHYGDADQQARVAATVPLGRLGRPDDIASACLFLASPLAAWVSGANLVVHGGGERPAFLGA